MTLSLPRLEAVVDGQGRRECAECGDYIDPKDWCAGCIKAKGPCGAPHTRDRKRADAAYCDSSCRARRRNTAN